MFTNALLTLKRKTKGKDSSGYATNSAPTAYLTDVPCLIGVDTFGRSRFSQGMDSRESGNDSLSIYQNLADPVLSDDIATVTHSGIRQDYVVTSARPTQSLVVSHWKLNLKPIGLPIVATKVGSFLGNINGDPYVTTGGLPVSEGDWYSLVLDASSNGTTTVYNYDISINVKQVFVNGLLQNGYTAVSGVLTLDAPAPAGTEVRIYYFQ